MNRLMHQRFWPQFTPVYAGTAESGAYDVQPAAAWPPSTKKPESMMTPALAVDPERQHVEERERHVARADHRAECRSSPKRAARIGMITKKIMIVACMVNAML